MPNDQRNIEEPSKIRNYLFAACQYLKLFIIPVVLIFINQYFISCGIDGNLLKNVPVASVVEPTFGSLIMLQNIDFAANETVGRTLWMQEKLPNLDGTINLANQLAQRVERETTLGANKKMTSSTTFEITEKMNTEFYTTTYGMGRLFFLKSRPTNPNINSEEARQFCEIAANSRYFYWVFWKTSFCEWRNNITTPYKNCSFASNDSFAVEECVEFIPAIMNYLESERHYELSRFFGVYTVFVTLRTEALRDGQNLISLWESALPEHMVTLATTCGLKWWISSLVSAAIGFALAGLFWIWKKVTHRVL